MKRELLELRTKLSKQDRLLQSTAERLKTANQQKECMEQFIFSQCGCPQARERKWGGRGVPDSTCAADGQCDQRGYGRGETDVTSQGG